MVIMNIFSEIKQEIIAAISIFGENLDIRNITTEFPKDPLHGDISTNAAMVLAPQLKINPRELALQIKDKLIKVDYITHIEVAGPGFINFTIKLAKWNEYLRSILEMGKAFGACNIGSGHKVNLEYVSANPTGPMHIGHARGAVYGDALANLLIKAGYDVCKEYYINDAGSQIDTLSESAFLRYIEAATGEKQNIPEGLYPGDYLVEVGKKIFEKYGDKLLHNKQLADVKKIAIQEMMELIKTDLADLGVFHNVFFSEESMHNAGLIAKEVEILKKKDLIYEGKLEAPKGQKDENWEDRTQLLFRSTNYGDDQDRPITKKDGSWTYFAADIAYAADKVRRGFDTIIMVLGADHAGYIKRIESVVKAVSDNKVAIDIKICQLVNFIQNGAPVKMSKRSGTFTTVRDVIDSVGKDIIRFMMLTRKNDALMDFDLEKVKETSKENPVFYVQYACVRAKSIIKNCAEQMPDSYAKFISGEANLSLLESEEEVQIIKLLASWPKIVENAAIYFEPHRIAFYLQNLASSFHGMWNYGKENASFRFISPEDAELTAARMVIVSCLLNVIYSGLEILGVEPMEKM
jgi:arginyl-tRNA synthetase